ncbi:MAG: hypothetical protein GZ088_09830 [Acidipila sp.]|nr:hypothetical protein [Acidipila sp.]
MPKLRSHALRPVRTKAKGHGFTAHPFDNPAPAPVNSGGNPGDPCNGAFFGDKDAITVIDASTHGAILDPATQRYYIPFIGKVTAVMVKDPATHQAKMVLNCQNFDGTACPGGMYIQGNCVKDVTGDETGGLNTKKSQNVALTTEKTANDTSVAIVYQLMADGIISGAYGKAMLSALASDHKNTVAAVKLGTYPESLNPASPMGPNDLLNLLQKAVMGEKFKLTAPATAASLQRLMRYATINNAEFSPWIAGYAKTTKSKALASMSKAIASVKQPKSPRQPFSPIPSHPSTTTTVASGASTTPTWGTPGHDAANASNDMLTGSLNQAIQTGHMLDSVILAAGSGGEWSFDAPSVQTEPEIPKPSPAEPAPTPTPKPAPTFHPNTNTSPPGDAPPYGGYSPPLGAFDPVQTGELFNVAVTLGAAYVLWRVLFGGRK